MSEPCRPAYSRSVCGGCEGQDSWCDTCGTSLCGCFVGCPVKQTPLPGLERDRLQAFFDGRG